MSKFTSVFKDLFLSGPRTKLPIVNTPPMPRVKPPRMSDEELREQNPALKNAWEQYQIILKLVDDRPHRVHRSQRLGDVFYIPRLENKNE